MGRDKKLTKLTVNQMRGYRAQLVGAVNQCQNGSVVELDLTSAGKIVEMLDLLLHYEGNFQS